jgi:hypothetical protein
MLVFRDTSREVSGSAAGRALRAAVGRMARDLNGDCAVEALLRAGELECAVADQASPAEPSLARLTDALSSHVLNAPAAPSLQTIVQAVEQTRWPEQLSLRIPEGYACDGLDPRRFASLARELGAPDRPTAVLGVRSIGTSLGAVLCEALVLCGRSAERISVRPSGEPWARELHLRAGERAFVDRMRDRHALFAVVDEGPGLSGSTLLAVAEALEQAGVEADSIALCCSRAVDPNTLLANEAVARWARYRRYAIAPTHAPEGSLDLSGGAWRRAQYGEQPQQWPAAWTQRERLKWRTRDGLWLDKYEGLRPYAGAAFERACTLARAGYAPAPAPLGCGFVRYPWLPGRPASATDLGPQALCELARYCAFRARACAAPEPATGELSNMLSANVKEALGVDLAGRAALEVRVPVIADARMQPHEWRFSGEKLYKTDGHSHGDGPLFPGPTDICWDLAGAIVEWNMDDAHAEAFLSNYARLAGERPEARLETYVLAYCAARMGEMCIAATQADDAEQPRLRAAYVQYSDRLGRALRAQRLWNGSPCAA